MENRKAVLELKDVPPPPPHHTSSQSSQPFSLATLPLLPPCLPPPQLAQNSHQQQPPQTQQQQDGSRPKVSICTHCDYCSRDGYGLLGGGGVVGSHNSLAGVVSLYMAQGSSGAPVISSNSINMSGPCSVASSVHKLNLNSGSEIPNPLLRCKPAAIATSQPVPSDSYLPCCSRLHTCPAVSLPCSQSNLFPSSGPLVSSLPSVSSLSGPLHGACLASSTCYNCGGVCSLSDRRSQTSTLSDHTTTTTVTTTTTSAHFCSNPLHLNVERTVLVKGAHYCKECLLKVGRVLFNHCGFLYIRFFLPQSCTYNCMVALNNVFS